MSNVFRKDFPIFTHWQNQGRPLVYLDSAATAQSPQVVIDAVKRYSEESHANVHRGIYALSEEATAAYEQARKKVRLFLNAASTAEVIFTKNATEGINLVALSLSRSFFKEGDHILISRAEHHSNFLPWQMLRDEKRVVLDIVDPVRGPHPRRGSPDGVSGLASNGVDVDESGKLSLEEIERAIHPRTKLAAFSHVSHVLGTINPIREMAQLFRERGILFLVDAAQSAAHLPIDVEDIGCDFLVFSGHKIGAPTGIGVLYGREKLLWDMPAVMRGGGMIREVSEEQMVCNDLPWKFEAGTPNIAGAVGLGAAVDYIGDIGFANIRRIDEELSQETIRRLSLVPGLRVLGPREPGERGGVVSFTIDAIHPHDLATILDRDGVCIRAGHHCAMPLMKWLGVPATARASFWVYNTVEDIDKMVEGIEKAISILKPKIQHEFLISNQIPMSND